jgi:hypothetical protein
VRDLTAQLVEALEQLSAREAELDEHEVIHYCTLLTLHEKHYCRGIDFQLHLF